MVSPELADMARQRTASSSRTWVSRRRWSRCSISSGATRTALGRPPVSVAKRRVISGLRESAERSRWRQRSGTSSRRSPRLGMVKRSVRRATRSCLSAPGSRLVAAMRRMSARRALEPPRRWYSPPSSTRSRLAWRLVGSSPISSRNRVPPSASPTRPGRSGIPALGYPLKFPNTSAATRPAGMVAAFRATKHCPEAARARGGRARRAPCRFRSRPGRARADRPWRSRRCDRGAATLRGSRRRSRARPARRSAALAGKSRSSLHLPEPPGTDEGGAGSSAAACRQAGSVHTAAPGHPPTTWRSGRRSRRRADRRSRRRGAAPARARGW